MKHGLIANDEIRATRNASRAYDQLRSYKEILRGTKPNSPRPILSACAMSWDARGSLIVSSRGGLLTARHGSGVKRDEDYHNPEMPSRIEIGERCAVGSGNQFHQVE